MAKEKKSKKGRTDEMLHNLTEEIETMAIDNVKSNAKGKKSKKDRLNIDNNESLVQDDEKQDINVVDNVKKKSNKSKGKKNRDFVEESDQVSDPEDGSDLVETKSKKSKRKPAGFSLLDIEGEDTALLDKEGEIEMPEKDSKSEKPAKKSKKKERRRKNEDSEDDIDKVLEQLAFEMSGQAAAVAPNIESTAANEPDPMKKKKKAEKKKPDKAERPDEEENPDNESELQHTVKTAAQKKKEKKEKEKQKKLAQSVHAQKQTTKQEETKEIEKPKEPALQNEEKGIVEDAEIEDETDDKKKKKKTKPTEEKKRPGKKQIAAMQEALKQIKLEEERLRLEEEAKLKAEEEAERLRQEKLRLEQEKKEKRKQFEKEKRERLRAEGKLLTKAQKQSKARMEATLAVLREQGVEVPQVGGTPVNAAPRPRDKRWVKKKKYQDVQEQPKSDTAVVEIKDVPEIAQPEEVSQNSTQVEGKLEEEEVLNVKDAWDESSDEESSSKVESSESDEAEQSESDDDSEDSDNDSEDGSSTDNDDSKTNQERIRQRAMERINKRREEAEAIRSVDKLRSPVVCVLGHVDTGKTKILDRIRRTNVQDSEAGGITQQIGATMVPEDALKDQCKHVKSFSASELKVPGLLIIDTPGHESFSNLRSRGSSLCDIAILVVDIMHGLEPQTIESIEMLKQKKTPFIVALNKIDRLYEWKSTKNKDIQNVLEIQARNTKMEFDDRYKEVIVQFAEQGLNAVLFYDNKDQRSYISIVPTSAMTGEGMGNLMALVVQLTQSMMAKRLAFSKELQATVLEVKALPGLGTTVDAILVNGCLNEGDTIVMAGYEGPLVTQIRSILMPQPLKELRVKNFYEEFKTVQGAQGVKLTGKDLDKAIAGLQLLVAKHPDEVQILKEEVAASFTEAMNNIKVADRGVYVQASTLGSLEALLDFLKTSKIPYSGIRIGPVVKKDVMKASIMLEHNDGQYAVILAFDVKIEKDAQELADSLGVKIFHADVIYHLFDKFTAYREEIKNKKRDELKSTAVFPCKLRILPQYIFNSRDPIVVGVVVEAGVVRDGTPLCVPSKEFLDIGIVTTIEVNHKAMEVARKGQEVCIKIDPTGGDAPKMYGRHFDHTDLLVSKITRQSIDVCKEHFRDDLQKTDWQLMVELKKTFQIL